MANSITFFDWHSTSTNKEETNDDDELSNKDDDKNELDNKHGIHEQPLRNIQITDDEDEQDSDEESLATEDVNEYSEDKQNLDTIDKEGEEMLTNNNEDDFKIAFDDFNVAKSETNNNSMIINETKE